MQEIVGEILGRPDVTLVNNNQVCIVKMNDLPYTPWNRDFGTKFKSIRKEIRYEYASMKYEPTKWMLADRLI